MNNTSILISFIVPVFNIEKYLVYCLDSLLAQGLNETNYEILLINDGSTDNSLSICLESTIRHNASKLYPPPAPYLSAGTVALQLLRHRRGG